MFARTTLSSRLNLASTAPSVVAPASAKLDLQLHATTCNGAPPQLPAASYPSASSPPADAAFTPALKQEDVDACCDDFIKWLGEPPLTHIEGQSKAKLLREEKQLKPVRDRLRCLFQLAQPHLDTPGAAPHLRQLTQESVVAPLLAELKARVQAERVYQLALLLKKVCLYLCARQSAASRLFIAPTSLSGWTSIIGIGYDSGKKRKLRQRDRMVLEEPAEAMTPEELRTLTKACLGQAGGARGRVGRGARVPAQLQPVLPHPLRRHAPWRRAGRRCASCRRTRWWRRSSPATPTPSASRRSTPRPSGPCCWRCPAPWTPQLEFYLKNVLGWPAYQGPLFLQRGGAARKDYTAVVKLVTEELLGRAVTAHPLRHAVATTIHDHPSSTDTMMRQLAESMNHSVEVQRSHYVYQNRVKAQGALHRVLLEGIEDEVEEEKEC